MQLSKLSKEQNTRALTCEGISTKTATKTNQFLAMDTYSEHHKQN